MYQEESIYNLIPKERFEYAKQPMYRSLYPPNIAPTASTFGLKTTSFPNIANLNGEFSLPRGGHPVRGLYTTLGKPNGFNQADPKNFIKKGHQYRTLPPPEKLRSTSEIRKPAIPTLADKPIMGLKSDKNYITANAVDIILMQPKRKRTEEKNYLTKPNYGKVPNYIATLRHKVEGEYQSIREMQMRTKEEEAKKKKVLAPEEIENLREGLKKKLEELKHAYGLRSHRNNTEVYAASRKEGLEREMQIIEKDLEKLNSNNTKRGKRQLMNCKICQLEYDPINRLPRNLFCGHSFCEQCLENYTQKEEISCPKCLKISHAKSIPICYAILDLLEHDLRNIRQDYCLLHIMEKNSFICKDCNRLICQVCYLEEHKAHGVNSEKQKEFIEEAKNEFLFQLLGLKEKLQCLNLIIKDIEKCEKFLDKLNDNQLHKIDDVIRDIKSSKKMKLERYENLISFNYLIQKEFIKEQLEKLEHAQKYKENDYIQIQELVDNKMDKTKAELAQYTLIKLENEFKKLLEDINSNTIEETNNITTFTFKGPKPESLLKDQYILYTFKNSALEDLMTNSGTCGILNHIIFFGDSKENNLILKFNLFDNKFTPLYLQSYPNETTDSFINYKLINSYRPDSPLSNNKNNLFEFNKKFYQKKSLGLALDRNPPVIALLDYMSACAFNNGTILLSGGCIYRNYKNTASKNAFLLTVKDEKIYYQPFKDMNNKRFSHGSLVVREKAYVFGGHDGNETLASLEYFDNEEFKWAGLQYMHIEREIFAFCKFRNRYIYVFGGYNSNHLDSIERYDTITDSWKLLSTRLKRPLQNAAAIELDYHSIVLIGGYNGTMHKCVDIFYVLESKWISLDNLQVPRRKPHCYTFNNKLIVFGGEKTQSERHLPEAFDFQSKVWSYIDVCDQTISKSLVFWSSVAIKLSSR